jgi:ribosomal protein S27E
VNCTPPTPSAPACCCAGALGVATVGLRVLVAGSTVACLRLRGIATIAGAEDDELCFTPTGTGLLDVFCAHCRAVTTAQAQVDDVVECSGCGHNLLVYHHVSRCSGQYLGFMVDAEQWTR